MVPSSWPGIPLFKLIEITLIEHFIAQVRQSICIDPRSWRDSSHRPMPASFQATPFPAASSLARPEQKPVWVWNIWSWTWIQYLFQWQRRLIWWRGWCQRGGATWRALVQLIELLVRPQGEKKLCIEFYCSSSTEVSLWQWSISHSSDPHRHLQAFEGIQFCRARITTESHPQLILDRPHEEGDVLLEPQGKLW